MGLDKYVIWDIDNCLADDKWRAHLIERGKTGNERYDAYSAMMTEDSAYWIKEFQFMARFAQPVFFTGRVAKWQQDTRRWLEVWGYIGGRVIAPLYMRDNDDSSTPAELKQKMLERLILRVGVENIIAAFDDIPAVIEMYEAHGVKGCLLQINTDHSGIYEPRDLAPVTNA